MFWVGGYGPDMEGSGSGIGRLRPRPDGSLEYLGAVIETPSPSYLVERAGHVYSTDEGRGTVSSFVRTGESLICDGTVDSSGQWPCQLGFLDDALVVANYNTGTLGVVGLAPDGSVSELLQTLHSPVPEGLAHASLVLTPHLLVSADLGAERLLLYSVSGTTLVQTGEVVMPTGTGPRDLLLHESGLLYVLGEHGGTVTVYERVDGMLELVTSAALPGFVHGDQAAAISFGAEGFLYAGVRGGNRVSVLRSTADGRAIEPTGWVGCEGDWPRHLTARAGALHVANQNSDAVASFALGSDGMPVLIREPEFVPSPTFLLHARA